MPRYAIVFADGSLAVMNTVGDADPKECVDKWNDGRLFSIHAVGDGDLPADRTFRNAWVHDGTKIVVDMPKAREIWRGKMRIARKPVLDGLDIEYQRADENSDTFRKAEIAREKQALRDITLHPDIDAAATPEQLKAVWIDGLGAIPKGVYRVGS